MLLLTESFLPHMNGVTNSVLRVVEELALRGDDILVVAPGPDSHPSLEVPVELVRSFPLPQYPQVRVAVAGSRRLVELMRRYRPDVIHLASPFVLGWQALVAADTLNIPTVAIYQTDVIAYAQKYGLPRGRALAASHTARLHRRATLTLAPSTAAIARLESLGVDRVRRWGRGVDARQFRPERRSDPLRERLAGGALIVGYVGRLAPEKQVADLAALRGIPGMRLVIVGDGPDRAALQRALPEAAFLGHLSGTALAEAVASFDVFVHPGESETFGQTIQEALASGTPVVATGAGGPVDLVRSSVDGWLYRPGDLGDLRARVEDLLGDHAKRRAFGAAAREGVASRTWEALTVDLVTHYEQAARLRAIDDALPARAAVRPELSEASVARPRWSRYVALGDSITEGLCDTSRMPAGEFRGWAERLAMLLAHERVQPFRFANLAVRSRKVADLTGAQLDRTLELRPDLVSVLIGANDLVGPSADPDLLAAQVDAAVARLRECGADVLLVTPFLPRRRTAMIFARRFARYNALLRGIARRHGCLLLDVEAHPAIGEHDMWADDKVHLRSRGHRFLAYRAAEVLGVRDAEALGELDAVLHSDEDLPAPGSWLARDALPWVWRRLRGRTAGDGRVAKHDDYVLVPRKRRTRTRQPG
ncbi:hypothetical protein GCM10022200_00370 [Microbacterium awajiense]|uniref:D-inositol 3-phosphate glycosyltransferase n=1 Tax=Microbacterium awajiense TaxID=415214 RepID=A0ABP7A140_9MICO